MARRRKATLLQANEPTIIRTKIEGTDLSMSFAVNDDGMISALLLKGMRVVAEEFSNGSGPANDRLAHTVLEWITEGQ
jgi:hypothetical protein